MIDQYVIIKNNFNNIEYMERHGRIDVLNLIKNNSVFIVNKENSHIPQIDTMWTLMNNKLFLSVVVFSYRTRPAVEHEIIAARLKGEI